MQRISQLALAFFTCVIFLGGAINLYPCAAGSAVVSSAKKSCHSSPKKSTEPEQKPKGEKPCCSLHCYNPATVQALVKMTPPVRTAIALRHEEHPPLSLTITPPLPPPRSA